jgi:hypothetical protein
MSFKEGLIKTIAVAGAITVACYASSLNEKARKDAASSAVFRSIPAVYSLDSTYRARMDSLEYQQYSLGKQCSSQRDSLRKVYASYIEKIVGGK